MSEYDSDYEEDFEEPHSPVEEAPRQPSPPRKASPTRQQRTPSQYTQNASASSLGTAKSRKPVHNERELRRLQKENQDLRTELKELNALILNQPVAGSIMVRHCRVCVPELDLIVYYLIRSI